MKHISEYLEKACVPGHHGGVIIKTPWDSMPTTVCKICGICCCSADDIEDARTLALAHVERAHPNEFSEAVQKGIDDFTGFHE